MIGHSSDGRLCNLRFADDVILVASSLQQLRSKIQDLALAAGDVGLKLHMGKTKILTNQQSKGTAETGGMHVDIVDSTPYLGRLLSLKDTHLVEVDNRLAKAWRKSMTLKGEVCSRHYPKYKA